jgi:bifunctional DNA-binding transcriptional regulator/antitoxin component of YhaV-PrlF toxin-antitoxin module
MRIAIDASGRLVVPKPLRDDLGIAGPTELEAAARDGVIELTVADVATRIEDRAGTPVIIADEPVPPLTTDDVRAAIDRVRR